MDLLPIAFLLLFVLLGGIIAVLADNVGRTLGKKRLKIWNLRPKHTAQLGTFIMGALISLFTIILVTIFSSDVRQWIIEGRRAVQQRNEALEDLKQTRTELGTVRRELEGRGKKIQQLDKDIKAKTKQVKDQGDKLVNLTTKITGLQNAAAQADRTIKNLDIERAATQRELNVRRDRLAQQQAQLKKVQAELRLAGLATKQQQELAKNAGEQKESTDKRNLELINENTKLEKSISTLQTDIQKLAADETELRVARDRAKDDLDEAQRQLTSYQSQLTTAQNELQSIVQQVRQAQRFYAQLHGQSRTEPLMYQFGEEVARIPADGGRSVSQAQDTLTALLRSARIAAIARGAKRSESLQEAGIVEHTDPITQEPITPELIERQVVQQIAGSSTPVVVIASSSFNAFRGEPVSLELQVLPNPLVYSKGQVLAETVIDGTKDEEAIFRQIEGLISKQIRERAQKDKIIPKLGSDQFGEVTPAEIYALMSKVKAVNRTIRVQAMAASDTRAADPLRLEFRLR
ncbi:MAG: DUF3084 domain-containing protein [Fimbriimonas sp.]